MKTTKKKSVSETGHNKNVANFSTVYQVLEEMDTLYNPTNPNITLVNLVPQKTQLQVVIKELNSKKPSYKNAVASREEKIKGLNRLTTRTLNFAKSVAISETDKENLQSQAKKIRGDSKPKKINPDTAAKETISTAQLSYDSRIANLETYIEQLASHELYNPNEEILQIASLKEYHQELSTLSSKVNKAGNALLTAREKRNALLYNNEGNIIQLMKEIKSYLKALGEEGKPYYKTIVKLRFTDIKK
jgi:hypothetical protein